MSSIRVTYTGLISFIISISTAVTGLIFVIIITRVLTLEEFGTFNLISGLVTYVYVFRPMISYWTTREIARGIETGRTALMSTSMLATVAIFIYFLIAYMFGENSNVDENVLLFAALLIPAEFFVNIFKSIAQGYKPQVGEYGILIFEFIKIPAALVLVYVLNLGLYGVIMSIFFANLASIILLLFLTRNKIKGVFKKIYVKKWLRLFWLPTYPQISQLINVSDVAVFTLITGSVNGLAFWGAAKTVAQIVKHSSKIGNAIYPKLLAGGKKEIFRENLVLMMYFSLPLTVMSIVFAKPVLFILNPLYDVAIWIVIFFVPTIFLRTLSELFTQSISGREKVDTKSDSTFKDYLKSKLFFIPTIVNIHRAGYLGTLIIVLLFLHYQNITEMELVISWSIVLLGTQIPYTVYLYSLVKREFSPNINMKPIIKYCISSVLAFGIQFILMEEFLEYKKSIFEFLPAFIPYMIMGMLTYIGITYLIESRTRKLLKGIIREINTKSRGRKNK